MSDPQIEELVQRRRRLLRDGWRTNAAYVEQELLQAGVRIEDTPHGTKWRRT